MSKSIAYKHHLRALSRWPKDPLRPDLQFQDAIRRRIDRRLGIAPRNEDSGEKKQAQSVMKSRALEPWNEEKELEQANVLYSLLEGRYARKYPITNTLMTPASNPSYYTDLIKELEAAPNRTWLARMMNRWKGFLRFK